MGELQGPNRDYHLHTLGWNGFQDLASIVVSEVYGINVQTFNKTRDAGQDGAFLIAAVPTRLDLIQGSGIIQCKHFGDSDASLTLSSVSDELVKASRLTLKGLADNYVLVTNGRVSASQRAIICDKFRGTAGIKNCVILDGNWLTKEIALSSRLRRIVPRVYGLGDLRYVIDDRASAQTRQVLVAMKYELATMVQTKAYFDCLRALQQYGFAMLVGEAASGKSTIAATLAMASLDEHNGLNCEEPMEAYKIRTPKDFAERFDPENPGQFFWVDDAFGSNSFQRGLTEEWSRYFKELQAAIKGGGKIIFTSRDYVFGSARANLLIDAFPLLRTAEVIIYLRDISQRERVQILYNHIKFGDQPKPYKRQLKPFLLKAALSPHFVPEVAKRLGNPEYTKDVAMTQEGVLDFVRRRGDYLIETIQKMDDDLKRALYVMFMLGGRIPSPLDPADVGLGQALRLNDLSVQGLRDAFKRADGSFIIVDSSEEYTFRHPTIRDAIASIVSADRELVDVYLAGTPLAILLAEVRCVGMVVTGAKVEVPTNRYALLRSRLEELTDAYQAVPFLADRADDKFLRAYIDKHPEVIAKLLQNWSWEDSPSARIVLRRLHDLSVLSAGDRATVVARIVEYCVETPSALVLADENISALLTDDERSDAISRLQSEVVPSLDDIIAQWGENYDVSNDPENYFAPLWSTLDSLSALLLSEGDSSGYVLVKEAETALQHIFDAAESDYHDANQEPDYDDDRRGTPSGSYDRDPFDDVDE
ncbi:MAG TPA: hypothetical protein VGU66_04030 [Candidatus Elarobacter sp.]|nr:hypothetical protein [Candidatus Elarobacter sp.]